MSYRHNQDQQHLNGASLDLGMLLGEVVADVRQIRVAQQETQAEVKRQGKLLQSIVERQRAKPRSKKSAPPRSTAADIKEWMSILTAVAVAAAIVSGKIATGDALGLFAKLAGH